MNKFVTIVAVTVGLSCCAAACAQTQRPAAKKTYQQTQAEQDLNRGTTSSKLLIDHGGPVLPSSTSYAIYWGTTTDFPADLQSGMESLLSGFNGSNYLGIAQQYMRGASVATLYGGALVDTSAPPAKPPTTANIAAEVCKLFPSPDPSAVYFVFTSNAPKVNYCAWHASATCNGTTFQIAYVPNQALLLSGCSPYLVANLGCNNLSEGTVASADSVAHEFMEAITDPQLNAWYDHGGAEIGDKCNFVYGSCVNLQHSKWQIQEEWSNAINGCQQQ
jgi:hypothetical protein